MQAPTPSISWEAKAAAKRTSILEQIPPEWRLQPADLERASLQRDLTGSFIEQFLDRDDAAIVRLDSVPIVNAVREGRLSAVRVTTAFCRAAAIAHQINNCLHEIFFDQALERARSLDDYYAHNDRSTVGLLHGLPVSIKDQFHVKDVDTTMGYVGWIGSNMGIVDRSQTHQVESQIVTELLTQGAILYCKTSLPQTLLMGETVNHIIGQTLNPHNRLLSCGGSSGGEGALMALRGSTLGLGTDIAGSVRIPAGFNGIFSLKPTPERLSYRDVANTNPGQNTCRSTIGLMSTSLGGLELGLQSILATEPWLRDPAVIPIPFRADIFDAYRARAGPDGTAKRGLANARPLKLGVLWSDGEVGLHPPVRRGLNMVVDAVKRAGHKTVLWNPPPHSTARRIHLAFLKADGAQHIHEQLALSGEPLIPSLLPVFPLQPPIDLLEYQDLILQGLAFEAQYAAYWNSTTEDDDQIVDAVLMPVAPHAAVIPGKYYHAGYTIIANLLNYSSVVIPVTTADKNIDVFDDSYKPLNQTDEANWKAYDPEVYHGGPVGIQIVARKYEEEKALALANIVFSALQTAKGSQAAVGSQS